MFLIGQIGTSNRATGFLKSLKDNTEIAPYIYVITGILLLSSFRNFVSLIARFVDSVQTSSTKSSRSCGTMNGRLSDG